MLNYLEYLNIPATVAFCIAVVFFGLQLIGEFLEKMGKIVPEFMKIRKYFARKKREKEVLAQLPEIFAEIRDVPATLKQVKALLSDVDKHYSKDNIAKRDGWINTVNTKLESNDQVIQELVRKLDQNNEDTLELKIESKRSTIIDFASYVIDDSRPVTREQFNRIFKTYNEYEDTIEKNGLTNGEVDIAYRIITEAYETHMRNCTFIEDIRGYDKSN